MGIFKKLYSKENRASEFLRIRNKYPDRVPIICEKSNSSNIEKLDKKKYLVPNDLTVGQFIYIIRKRLKLSAESAIFIFVKDILPPSSSSILEIYEKYKDDDGFLYLTYSGENTFGY